MTQIELIDRLCAVNTLLTDIVREQAEIMAQHGIEAIQTQDEATDRLDDLFGKHKRAEDENDAIEAALRNYIWRRKKKMAIEVSLLLSGVSIAFAIFFGISTRNRNVKKDTQDEAREDATILTKLENIQNTMIEVKSEMGSYRNEMKEIREYYIRASESLKQLHKRVDRIDKIIDESHPHQYIEE